MKAIKKLALLIPFILFNQVSVADIVCPSVEYEDSYKSNLPIIDTDEIIQSSNSLLPKGRIVCKVSFDYKTLKNNQRYRVEEGIYKGIKYRIYFSDGSGTIQGLPTNTLDYVNDRHSTNWSTSCEKDLMEDTHWCQLHKEDLWVGIWKDKTPFVNIGSNHFPGSMMSIRIDKNKPISATEDRGFRKSEIDIIIEQLVKGDMVATRYKEWPYHGNIDKSFGLFGFSQAWEILHKIYDAASLR